MADDPVLAVHGAMTRVQPLLHELVEAEKECHTALGYLEALRRKLEEDKRTLEDAVPLARGADEEVEVQRCDAGTTVTLFLEPNPRVAEVELRDEQVALAGNEDGEWQETLLALRKLVETAIDKFQQRMKEAAEHTEEK